MVDSVVTWAREYKVDGFRFDLMGHHSKANMLAVRAALDALTLAEDGVDGRSIYLYGEGWNFGEVAEQRPLRPGHPAQHGRHRDRHVQRPAARRRPRRRPVRRRRRRRQPGLRSRAVLRPERVPVDGTRRPSRRRGCCCYSDQIKVGLTGNLADYEFVDRTGTPGDGLAGRLQRLARPATPATRRRAIIYVEAHDNETLFDILAYKLPQDTTHGATACGPRTVGLSTVALLAQGVPFVHAGVGAAALQVAGPQLATTRATGSTGCSSTVSANNFGVGLPRESDNGGAWPIMAPILENAGIAPAPSDIAWTAARVRELLEIRNSSRLFRLGSAAEVSARLTFANGGPNQVPGLIVMRISDKVGADLDPDVESMIVIFNASDTTQTVTLRDTARGHFRLHKVQRTSEDETVTLSKYTQKTGSFTVPARTTAVFFEAK